MIRSSLKRIINKLGYELIPASKRNNSNDPLHHSSAITWKKIRLIVLSM